MAFDGTALAFLRSHPAKPVPLIGTTNAERLRSAVARPDLRLERTAWYSIYEAAIGRRMP